jgi:opacity protein-like surface antigen
MKNIATMAALVAALSAGLAFAADLPSQKAPPAPPVLSCTGAYTGLNAGYNWGTNGNVSSQTTPLLGQKPPPKLGSLSVMPQGLLL